MENIRISIIIVVHDQAEILSKNLPGFLSVAKEADAEVIVVDDMSTDTTPDVLKQLRGEYDNLYTACLPQSVIINPSRMRLALTVGVKATRGEYIVIADITRPPVSTEWLTELADGEVAAVFTNRKRDEVKHLVGTHVEDLFPMVLKAERKGGQGHRGRWLKFRRGLYDAVSVKRGHAFDLVKQFDQKASGWKLVGLRLGQWI